VHVLHVATGPALVALAVIVAAGIVFWLVRRGRRVAAGSLAEAACPACLALAYLAEQPPELQALTRGDDTATGQVLPTGQGPAHPPSATAD
jgi:hypothetical protein